MVLQVRNEFYKDSQGVILVYDVGLRESFDALDSWLTEMKQEMGSQANMESIIFVVCANKVSFFFPTYSEFVYILWLIASYAVILFVSKRPLWLPNLDPRVALPFTF